MSKNVQKWDVWLFSFWLGFCLCDAENIRYMSLFFSFNRYNSKHISESFLADWGDRSSLGPWSERKWSLLCCRARNSKCVGSDAAGAQEWVRWYTAPQFLICKESLNDFPLQLTQLIRKACGRNLNCGITVGITMRQSCQLCWSQAHPVFQQQQLLLPQWKTSMEVWWVYAGFGQKLTSCSYFSF